MSESVKEKALAYAQEQGLTKTSKIRDVWSYLSGKSDSIRSVLPKHLTPERMLRVFVSAIARNPKLLQCDINSLMKCMVETSEYGLEPSGILGHSYLVPFKNGKTGKLECQLQIGYRGFIELANRSGKISAISAEVVYEGDEFDYQLGTDRFLKHKPKMRKPGEPMSPVCAYATVDYKDGAKDFELVSIEKLDAAQKMSKTGSGPWQTHWEEMARKTAIRRLAKRLPLSPELIRASVADEYKEAGVTESIDTSFVDVEETGEVSGASDLQE